MEQPQNPVTGVLVLLTAKTGVTREQVMKLMPAEIRATVRLYLEGKIQQWYARGDGKGAVFILDSNAVRGESVGSRVHSYRPTKAPRPFARRLAPGVNGSLAVGIMSVNQWR